MPRCVDGLEALNSRLPLAPVLALAAGLGRDLAQRRQQIVDRAALPVLISKSADALRDAVPPSQRVVTAAIHSVDLTS